MFGFRSRRKLDRYTQDCQRFVDIAMNSSVGVYVMAQIRAEHPEMAYKFIELHARRMLTNVYHKTYPYTH